MNAHDYFAHTPTITIATATEDGRHITTPIWGILLDGVPYIRNGYGETSNWYRRLRRTGRAAFLDHDRRYQARAELVTDEETKRRVDEAYKAKYRGQGIALRQAVSRPARNYTLKVTLDD